MILWKEGAVGPDRTVVLKALILAGLVASTSAVLVLSIAHFHGRIRPDLLLSAGRIELKPLTAGVSSQTIYGPANGKGNAAAHYILALNSYALRRRPYLKGRGFKAFVEEPPVTAAEINELELGARRANCDFYAESKGIPQFKIANAGKGWWAYTPALSPDEERPYYTPMRLLLVGLIYQADALVKAGKWPQANRLYKLVVRVGSHIRQRPGCVLDFELGLEAESRAARNMEAAAKSTNRALLKKIVRYREAIEKLGERHRRKYAQLDNPEAAAIIAARDTDPMWRIEAAAALRDQPFHHALGLLERRRARAAFEKTLNDPNPRVRMAASRLSRTQPQTPKEDNDKPL